MDEEQIQNIRNRCKWRARIRTCDAIVKWRYGNPITGKPRIFLCYKGKNVATVPIYEDTLGQYVGRNDKNGKEIYEGDILRYPGGKLVIVVYDKDEHAFILRSVVDNSPITFHKDREQFLEIIGNIHDNPELLNK